MKEFEQTWEEATNLKSPGSEFNTNGGFRFQTELIPGESRKYV